jgi:hypothetical protein
MFEKIHDVVTGETTEVPYSKQQIAEVKENQKNLLVKQAESEARAAEKQALLDRLGITSEEAQLLLS